MAYFYRGNVYAAQGNWALALAEYKTALVIHSGNPLFQQALETAQRQLGR
jgi:tetratricopeptide (TPR) repeat protein